MRNQQQGVRSTKVRSSQLLTQQFGEATLCPEEKQRNVFLAVYETKGNFHMDQTGKLPHILSRGNQYQMILHKIDGKSTCIEPVKNKT